jgi:hypothetical protein
MTDPDFRLEDLVIPENNQIPHVPANLIKITSDGGNIGRFYWNNQQRFSIEQWGNNGFYEATIYEIPGVSAWLWTEFERIGWQLGMFEP